jgi:tellurite resistance protein TehA-like permease
MNSLKLFTRIDASTVKQTIQLYMDEVRHDKRQVITYAILIPTGHFLYIVLLPLLISLIIQTLLTNPQDTATLAWLVGGMIGTSILTLIVNFNGFPRLFNQEEAACTRLTTKAQDKLLLHSHQFFANK